MNEEKVESSVSFDERRKELTHKTKEERPAMIGKTRIGKLRIESEGIYNEEGIREILKNLNQRRTNLEQNIKTLKEAKEEDQDFTEEEIKEIKKFKKLQEKLKEMNKHEEQRNRLEGLEKELKKVRKDIADIKQAIGNRLKL